VTLGAAGALLIVGSALAQFPPVTDPTKDEQKCEKSTGTALTKFVGAKSKCIAKCISTARKSSGPYGGCFGPGFADPVTFNCVFDTSKGAEAKAAAAIVKACNPEPGKDRCPECYGPAVCSTNSGANPFVQNVESQVDPFGNLIYCTEAGGGTPTKAAAKCEDTVSKVLVKFVSSKSKCYQKCNDNMNKGKIAPGSCTPPASDPATQTCITKAEDKTVTGIDKVCETSVNPKNEKPACYSGQTGTGWMTLVESNIDSTTPIIACGSPSGAFLN